MYFLFLVDVNAIALKIYKIFMKLLYGLMVSDVPKASLTDLTHLLDSRLLKIQTC